MFLLNRRNRFCLSVFSSPGEDYLCPQDEFTLILKFMVCSNPSIVDTMSIYTIPTPKVISRMISEDNLVNWRKYTETIYLDYDSLSCPIVVFGSDEMFSICWSL